MTPPSVVAACACLSFGLLLAAAQDLDEGDVCKTVRGRRWTCKNVRQCPPAIQQLQSGGRPEICRYAKDPIVCCDPGSTSNTPTRGPTPATTIKPKPTANAGAKARQMCKEYGKLVFITISGWGFGSSDQRIDTCNQLDTLIVGGKNARAREFPHMAQVGYGNGPNNIKWKCGGSLISKRFVVSAAHCTEIYNVPAKWVRLGEYNVATKDDETSGDARPAVYEIAERINHPRYRPPNNEHDIALYRLTKDVEFNEYVRPICLQPDTFIRQNYGTVTGWGNTDFGGKNSAILQKVNVTLISTRQCSTHYPVNKDNLPQGIRGDSMLCAGDTFSRKDSCQGDSGGPLQVLHPEIYCTYNLVGIVSFGQGCGTKPGVYTRVSNYISWIEKIVWP